MKHWGWNTKRLFWKEAQILTESKNENLSFEKMKKTNDSLGSFCQWDFKKHWTVTVGFVQRKCFSFMFGLLCMFRKVFWFVCWMSGLFELLHPKKEMWTELWFHFAWVLLDMVNSAGMKSFEAHHNHLIWDSSHYSSSVLQWPHVVQTETSLHAFLQGTDMWNLKLPSFATGL